MRSDSADCKVLAATLLAFLAAAVDARAVEEGPGDWLQKMATAVQTTNYEGTVIRIQDGIAEAIKVVHLVADGVVRERVIVQEGNGLEIIRNGNEVHCILPDRKSVLVQEWDDQSTLFSTLPTSDIQFGSEYDVAIVRQDRVAGRQAVMLAIRPHDGLRYGHRLWLDRETGFPLQTNLIAGDGEAIQQVKFADIKIGETIHASALQPSTNIDDFRWFTEPQEGRKQEIESDWISNNAPSGFRLTSTHAEESPGMGGSTKHMLLSDGLANVSVFIAPHNGDAEVRRARVAASNSFSIAKGEYRITAVGEVPAETVEQIARSMQPK
ncbi:MAG: MucB/RseB C-terminal domain-containing protein [Gammaproteobacteria bacterium]|nr:MucB/RseB C-terminal domain-containing protein [Gammaproteobacteria bacterium]MDH5303265.1 MucB/RseB C-terminal domain-containing protein [Gammaproteobacteria bacterium]MDH5322033.1 MucB/RseB C-terminal domain-containing protein [Gammaproteobacteria bacterium]